jgi:hypothetical protein
MKTPIYRINSGNANIQMAQLSNTESISNWKNNGFFIKAFAICRDLCVFVYVCVCLSDCPSVCLCEFTNNVIQWYCFVEILGIGPKSLINLYQYDVIFTQNITGKGLLIH